MSNIEEMEIRDEVVIEEIGKEEESLGSLVIEEEVDMIALRKIRDNFTECFKRFGGLLIYDSKDGEKKEVDEKTALTMINKYYNMKLKTNKVNYHFQKRLKSGRRFANDGLSLQGISRKIRHTIAKDIYYDIDMKNAHPTFCYYESKKLTFEHRILEMYITKRDECLNRWIGTFVGNKKNQTPLKDKDEVKTYFLKVLNGGGNAETSCAELNEYYTTHQLFMDIIFKHPDYKRFRDRAINKYKEKKKDDKKKDFDNRKGTCLNYFLCDIENKALTQMEIFLTNQGIRYGALCFDGIMVYVEDVKDLHELLTELENVLKITMGYPILLSVKVMNEHIDISDLSIREDIKVSDEDYALYLLDKLKDDLLYDSYDKQMWFWNEEEALWRAQDKAHLRTLMSQILIPYIETSPDPDIVTKESSLIKSNMKQTALTTMCEPYIKKRRDDDFIAQHFDRKKGLFPILDKKVIDLRTSQIRDRRKDDYFTKTTSNRIVEVDSQIRTEILNYYSDLLTIPENKEQNQERVVPSIEYRDSLISVFSYAMTTENHLKKFINLIGPKDGGKSLCLQIHDSIMDQFGGAANERLFVAQKNKSVHDSEMFNLIGKKMIALTETSEDQRFNEDLIKKISGGDSVNIRGAGEKKTFDIKFDTIMFLATNNMCKFNDDAFKDRLLCFNFINKFEKNAAIPLRMNSLKNHFFTILVEYAKKFYDNNLSINFSKEVYNYTKFVVQSADPFQKWLSNCEFSLSTEEGSYVSKEDVYDSYKKFCIDEKEKSLGSTSFHKQYSSVMKIESKKMSKRNSFTNQMDQFYGYEGIKKD